ncbi:UDP-glucose/GDP-mannose dehydrogenase family protein [Sporomusa aerivorans]|uniref:UDP-glucose dehydrogenase family protein n=1 Tax=Sporomusa aerivorans TaxID=204936 RepID=UPI00352A7B0F
MNILVLGLGFVGLTTALGLAEKGNIVYGFDSDTSRNDTLLAGTVPFLEPGLEDALNRNLNETFFIQYDLAEVARKSDVIFICVGTPAGVDGETNLDYVYSALDSIIPVLAGDKFRVVVIKSTVPPSTTRDKIIPYLSEKGAIAAVVNNPEFLREGNCWNDFLYPDRIVCGASQEEAIQAMRNLYSSFNAPFYAVSLNTGEFIKYLSNTFLATLISYSNEMSIIAGTIGDIAVRDAFRILHKDKRWVDCSMQSYVYPGCGFGGYCLPKDLESMIFQAKKHHYKPQILQSVMDINISMPDSAVKKIINTSSPQQAIGILGLSFKPESDDVRDTPAAKIIHLLREHGYTNLKAYDPVANDAFASCYAFDHIEYCSSLDELCNKSDTIALVTAWPQFAAINRKFPDKQWIDCRYYLE